MNTCTFIVLGNDSEHSEHSEHMHVHSSGNVAAHSEHMHVHSSGNTQ